MCFRFSVLCVCVCVLLFAMNMVGCIYSLFLPPWQSLTCLQLFTPMSCSQVSSMKLTPFPAPASPVSRMGMINRFKFSSCHNQLRNRRGHKVQIWQANEELRNQEWNSYTTANNICFDQYSHFIFLEKLFFPNLKDPKGGKKKKTNLYMLFLACQWVFMESSKNLDPWITHFAQIGLYLWSV